MSGKRSKYKTEYSTFASMQGCLKIKRPELTVRVLRRSNSANKCFARHIVRVPSQCEKLIKCLPDFKLMQINLGISGHRKKAFGEDSLVDVSDNNSLIIIPIRHKQDVVEMLHGTDAGCAATKDRIQQFLVYYRRQVRGCNTTFLEKQRPLVLKVLFRLCCVLALCILEHLHSPSLRFCSKRARIERVASRALADMELCAPLIHPPLFIHTSYAAFTETRLTTRSNACSGRISTACLSPCAAMARSSQHTRACIIGSHIRYRRPRFCNIIMERSPSEHVTSHWPSLWCPQACNLSRCCSSDSSVSLLVL